MWDQIPTNNLRISLVQTDLEWHKPTDNRRMLTKLMKPLTGNTDLVVLPEMFTSGYTLEPESAEFDDQNAPTTSWMIDQARQLNAAICGSVLFRAGERGDQGVHYNRLLFVTPEGTVQTYDKTHLFRMAGEHKRYGSGTSREIFIYKDWRILPTVCYDLRFPVFLRNRGDYDLMLCVANWPSARAEAWRTLLRARAIENLSYVAGVNRIGTDGNGHSYSGDSMLIDFEGGKLVEKQPNEAFVATGILDAEHLGKFRKRFPAWQDADQFTLPDFD